MIHASITANLKVITDFKEFTKDIRTKVIETGLDKPLQIFIQKLKQDLNYIINTRIKNIDSTKKQDTLGNDKISIPKSDEEIIKHITGTDIPKINKSKDYSTPVKDGVLFVDNYRVRLRLPISPFSEYDEVFSQAKKFFNEALFVIKDGNEIKYLKNPGIDISQFVKVVCSTDTGDTDKARRKFGHYRDSKRMSKQEDSEIGRYAEWSLKQDAVKKIMNPTSGFVNLTDIVKKIKAGEFEDATELAKKIQDKNVSLKTIEQVEQLKENKNVNPTTQSYINIINLIKNLNIYKQIDNEIVNYSLVSKFQGSVDEIREEQLFEEIQKNINLWSIENSSVWFSELVKVAEKTIQDFYKEG